VRDAVVRDAVVGDAVDAVVGECEMPLGSVVWTGRKGSHWKVSFGWCKEKTE